MAQERNDQDLMQYEALAQEALRGVVKAALKRAALPRAAVLWSVLPYRPLPTAAATAARDYRTRAGVSWPMVARPPPHPRPITRPYR